MGLTPRYNLSHVIDGTKRLSEIIVNGPGNLKILPASSGIQEMTKLTSVQKLEIFNELNALLSGYDIVLIDTAAGLGEEEIPDLIIAEPVGSCTDLIATVSYPLRRIYGHRYSVAPLSVLVDPVQ